MSNAHVSQMSCLSASLALVLCIGVADLLRAESPEWRTPKKPIPKHDASMVRTDPDPEESAPPQPASKRKTLSNTEPARRPATLARLIVNPDQTAGAPPYALTDQTGTVQRYVEPVPGIDIAAYVGQIVGVQNDTGTTLLASQLNLPRQPLQPLAAAAPFANYGPNGNYGYPGTPGYPGMLPLRPVSQYSVQQAQYIDNDDSSVQLLPEDMPMPGGGPQQLQMIGGYPGQMMPGQMCGPEGCGPQYCDPNMCPPGMMQPYAGPMVGPCPQDDCQPQCSCGPPAPRFTVFADYLFLQPTDADVTHAQQQNGIGGAGTVPFGDIGTIDMDFDSGIRLGGAYHCGPCSSVLLSYTFFETDASDSVAAPEIPGGGGAVGSLVHHPGASITASDGPVDATYDIQFQVADTLYRQQWLHGNNYTINFLVGAQYGHLEQDFAQAGIFSGGNAGAIDTTSSIRFDGGGLKAGFDTERQLGHGFALYGRCAAAAMQGKFRAQYSLNNATTESLLAAANWSDNRIVPQLEYEAGIGWQSAGGRLQLSAGYMMSRWLNTVTTSEFIDAVERDNYVNVGDTLSFAGLVASLGCSW